MLLLVACAAPEAEPAPTPSVVILVTIDAMNDRFYGMNHPTWNTTPFLDTLFEESVVLPDVTSVRGLTRVALPALHTGVYPRTSGVRSSETELNPGIDDLFKLFHDAGWATVGVSTNMCTVMDFFPSALDTRTCIDGGIPDDTEQDQHDVDAVQALLAAVEARDPKRSLFARLHLNDAHAPYTPVPEWLSELHPEPWTGSWDPTSNDAIDERILDGTPLTEEEQRWLHAVYASQVRGLDANLGTLFDGLRALGVYDDAILVFGSDHGDELALRTNYTAHGCSFYDTVLGTVYAVRAPGLPAGVLSGHTSIVDIAPTLLELAGLDIPVGLDGRSLAAELRSNTPLVRSAYFERGLATAGVVKDGLKVVVNPLGDFRQCEPYDQTDDAAYPNETLEIYDLTLDPEERENLAAAPPAAAEALHDELCTWITRETWMPSMEGDATSPLVVACRQRLAME